MAKNWRSAYFKQAKSDYQILLLLLDQTNVPLCQVLHYLQMTTEKMAKGFLTRSEHGEYEKVHDAFVRFVRVSKTRSEVRIICNFAQVSAFINYIDALIPTAQAIENLSPEGAPHANPEYPWANPDKLAVENDRIITPLTYDFPGLKLTDLKMRRMLLFLGKCFELIERES